MTFPLSSQLLADDDVDDAYEFDLDFDEDFEYLSDDEFEVIIDADGYEFDEFAVLDGEFDLDEALDEYGLFDSSEDMDPMTETDCMDEE